MASKSIATTAFTAAQAAQKAYEFLASAVEKFTAAQAAQKGDDRVLEEQGSM